jgi:hypothetical protein
MRLPFLPPAELSAEQKPLYEEMKGGIAAKYSNFTTMRGDGAILGPWSAFGEAFGEAHLRRILRSYSRYYNNIRTYRSLDKDAPVSRPVQRVRSIKSFAILGKAPSPLCPDLGFRYTASGNRENVR